MEWHATQSHDFPAAHARLQPHSMGSPRAQSAAVEAPPNWCERYSQPLHTKLTDYNKTSVFMKCARNLQFCKESESSKKGPGCSYNIAACQAGQLGSDACSRGLIALEASHAKQKAKGSVLAWGPRPCCDSFKDPW
jgi:hypothetical protein